MLELHTLVPLVHIRELMDLTLLNQDNMLEVQKDNMKFQEQTTILQREINTNMEKDTANQWEDQR